MASQLPALSLALPLLAAVLLLGAGGRAPRWLADAVAIPTAAATATLCALQLAVVRDTPAVSWLGGWRPAAGAAMGIPLVADRTAAATALLVGLVALACFVFAARYFETVGGLYHTLMLLLLAGVLGVAWSGDLFNLFVFLELASVSSFALTAFQVDHPGPLQGGMSFAVIHTLGTTVLLLGIGLVYGATGVLDLAGIGRRLAAAPAPADPALAAGFLLLVAGLLIKSGSFPFHFAHADAESVAPSPALPLLTGGPLLVAALAVARLWVVFAPAFAGRERAFGALLVAAGGVTAAVAALMCFRQRQLKRLLAFSTLAHVGIGIVGIGLLGRRALAGAGLYLLAHAAVEGALFLCVGVVDHLFGGISEPDLHGAAGGRRLLAALVLLGGLALAGAPWLGLHTGKALIEEEAGRLGLGALAGLLLAVSVLTGAAVLRFGGRVFLGLGAAPDAAGEGERQTDEETEQERADTSAGWMTAAAAALLALGVAAGLPVWIPAAESAARQVQDRAAYAALVLDGRATAAPTLASEPLAAKSRWVGAAGALAAIALAALALLAEGRRSAGWRGLRRLARAPSAMLEPWHSGHVGDYVTWLVLGLAAIGAGGLALLR